jgi:transcriptional regulator with XRE-family HTH domain
MMRRGVGRAVIELRRSQQWDQTQLAEEMHRYHRGAGLMPPPHRITVSRWECGTNMPSILHRIVLSKIAASHGEHALEEALAAPLKAWQFLGALIEIGISCYLELGAVVPTL